MKVGTEANQNNHPHSPPPPPPHRSCPLGDLWTSRNDLAVDMIRSIAIDDNDRNDENDNDNDNNNSSKNTELALCFRNHCQVPLLLCWVDEDGQPHHFYRLEPSRRAQHEPTDPMVVVTVEDWVEQTQLGQAFVIVYVPEEEEEEHAMKQRQTQQSLEGTILVGGYRPRILKPPPPPSPRQAEKETNSDDDDSRDNSDDDDDDDDDKHPVHIIEIFPERATGGSHSSSSTNLRGASTTIQRDDNDGPTPTGWYLNVTLGEIDPTPMDTTSKMYTATTLGGWPVFLDPEWESAPQHYRDLLERDLQQLCRMLPPHAVTYLQANTPLWVNCSFQYGPQACPMEGNGCCFHPDVDWLIEHGCHPQKVECVELYNLENEYECDYLLWGPGGILVHEFSHAYHFKCLPGGYDNPEIVACYKAAMKEGLYDEVEVHDEDDGKVRKRAYACESAMEYFAELSTAFLGGLDNDSEYNKWYPFNRQQVKGHDPRMYNVLKKVWKVTIDEDDDDDDDEKENGTNK